MKLCFVIQRYGADVAGGSELHCRWLATRLARRHEVQVVTTCALDYIEWRNHYPAGRTDVDGIPVTRFPVSHRRDEHRFAQVSELVFHEAHGLDDERQWVQENGPRSPALLRALTAMPDIDFFLFYSYRYYQTFFGLPRVADRAILIPTAEEDPAVRLPIFRDLFRAPRGILYLTPEERELVAGVSGNEDVPSAVIGSGLESPAASAPIDLKDRFGLEGDYLLYVGRIDRNKGVDRLFEFYVWLAAEWPEAPPLILIGAPILPIPEHPKIRHLGFVSDADKQAVLSASTVLLMPSRYESLSIVALEAWAAARPVLANAACRVLEGQCCRSGGGLFYRGYAEFRMALRLLVSRPDLRRALGLAGQAYVSRESDWAVVEQRTNAFLHDLMGNDRGRTASMPVAALAQPSTNPGKHLT